ncbi:hypothetical protein [Larkinella rosea]|uniref:Lipocalin-like domain-containing protein n=1 Tax=Larkinella rosea TaxID=2025312 RepID=A0A3P1BMU5_9BACT|nr:hypothetical protein [Larkinella rosea]RRB02358.1 hypothetical protein EHT25_17970 [Larkinella rosea]
MKQLVLFCLILITVLSCKQLDQDPVTADPLYRKWKLIETKSRTGDWETASYQSVIEFRPNGRILNHTNGRPCCSPVQVDRQLNTLKVTQIYACPEALCVKLSAYQIVSLTANELILDSVYEYTNLNGHVSMKYILMN